MSPDNALNIDAVTTYSSQWPNDSDLVVAGDFNSDLEAPEGNAQCEEIAADITTAGVEDTSAHFIPRHNPWLR